VPQRVTSILGQLAMIAIMVGILFLSLRESRFGLRLLVWFMLAGVFFAVTVRLIK
jgi:hypothetical protein